MIQNDQFHIVCKDHKQKVNQVCLYSKCKENRFICQVCIKLKKHNMHQSDWEELDCLPKQAEKNKTIIQPLVKKFNQKIEQITSVLKQLIIGIQEKYNFFPQFQEKIDSYSAQEIFNSILMFEKEDLIILQNIEKNLTDQIIQINNKISQLKLEKNHKSLILSREELFNKIFQEGKAFYENNEYEKAAERFDESLNYQLKNIDALLMKGRALSFCGKYEESLECFNNALILNPENVEAIQKKGWSLRMTQKYQEALSWYDKALSIDPQHQESIFWKCECLRQVGNYAESVEILDQFLMKNPQNMRFVREKGESLREMGQFQDSIDCQNEVLKYNSQEEFSLAGKGQCLAALKKNEEALEYFDKLLKLRSDNVYYYVYKIKSLIQLKQLQLAKQFLGIAKTINPENYYVKEQEKCLNLELENYNTQQQMNI